MMQSAAGHFSREILTSSTLISPWEKQNPAEAGWLNHSSKDADQAERSPKSVSASHSSSVFSAELDRPDSSRCGVPESFTALNECAAAVAYRQRVNLRRAQRCGYRIDSPDYKQVAIPQDMLFT